MDLVEAAQGEILEQSPKTSMGLLQTAWGWSQGRLGWAGG